jgi:hypothetical protein
MNMKETCIKRTPMNSRRDRSLGEFVILSLGDSSRRNGSGIVAIGTCQQIHLDEVIAIAISFPLIRHSAEMRVDLYLPGLGRSP